MNENREEAVRRRAYELWEEEGRPDGREGAHWRRAEDEFGAGAGSGGAAAGEGAEEDTGGGAGKPARTAARRRSPPGESAPAAPRRPRAGGKRDPG